MALFLIVPSYLFYSVKTLGNCFCAFIKMLCDHVCDGLQVMAALTPCAIFMYLGLTERGPSSGLTFPRDPY
jgi:hypothetical protein